jgi:hypothetical protein
MTNRASIFETPNIDVEAFTRRRPDPAALDELSQGSKFRSRDPVEPAQQGRVPHTYRTGRNVTFSAKTTQAILDTFYEIARQQGWKAAETLEYAIAALQRELQK